MFTDGQYTNSGLWAESGVIGWETKKPIGITIDLGKDQPISGISFSSICENSDWVQWPADIQVFTSVDSEAWNYAGDLLSLSRKNGEPSMVGPAKFRFVTHELTAHGRYVSVIVFPHMECFFCDEIEVYGGDASLAAKAISEPSVKDPMADALRRYFDSRIQYRLDSDLKGVRNAVSLSTISDSDKSSLNAKLDGIEKRIPSVHGENTPSFRAIIPINDVDAEIFSVSGSLMKASGLPSLFAWKANRYDLLSVTNIPQTKPETANISVSMMKGEYRADSFLLTNASDKPVDARLNIKGLPGGRKPKWLSVYAIPWTDTNLGIPVAAALVPAAYEKGKFIVHIPAGMSSKVWLTVDSSKVKSGNYHGEVIAKVPGQSVSLPFDLHVSSVRMARPRLSFTEWDYTFAPGTYAITPKNIDAAVELMKTHFVDSPWARPENLAVPDKDAFDQQGNLVKPLTFPGFDVWVNRWKNARHYLIFLNSPTSIAGFEMGTKEFDIRVTNWAKAFGDHIRTLGLKPEQVGVMVKDEPNPEALKTILAWAKPIKEAIPGIIIFQDCNNSAAYKTPNEIQAHHLANISCPEIGPFYVGGEENWKFFTGLLSPTHENWFYQCYGPTRVLDPYQYNRLEAWHCFKYGTNRNGSVGVCRHERIQELMERVHQRRPVVQPGLLQRRRGLQRRSLRRLARRHRGLRVSDDAEGCIAKQQECSIQIAGGRTSESVSRFRLRREVQPRCKTMDSEQRPLKSGQFPTPNPQPPGKDGPARQVQVVVTS